MKYDFCLGFTDKENKEINTISSPFKKSLVWPSKISSDKKKKSTKKVSTETFDFGRVAKSAITNTR